MLTIEWWTADPNDPADGGHYDSERDLHSDVDLAAALIRRSLAAGLPITIIVDKSLDSD